MPLERVDKERLARITDFLHLDIRWQGIENFIGADWKAYELFLDSVKMRLI